MAVQQQHHQHHDDDNDDDDDGDDDHHHYQLSAQLSGPSSRSFASADFRLNFRLFSHFMLELQMSDFRSQNAHF